MFLIGQTGDDGKRAEGHERVSQQVEKQRQSAPLFTHNEGDEQITRMSDAGVCKHPFDARLTDSEQIAHRHRRNRQNPQRNGPIRI